LQPQELPTNLFLALRFGEADEDPPTPQADLAKPVPGLSEEAELGEPVEVDSNELRQKAAVYRQAAEQMEAEADRVAGLDSAASSDYNLSVGEALDAGVGVGADGKAKAAGADADSKTVLSTPALLASCKKSWPFQIKATAQTTHVCVKCKPDAPLAYAIGKHGKHLIWACDATKFKDKELCKKSLKWLGKQTSETGASAETTCLRLKRLIGQNDNAAKVYSKHSQDLKLSDTAKLTSVSLYDNYQISTTKSTTSMTILGKTRMQVEKTISVALRGRDAQVFTVLSHTVRACGYISEQPLQCLDMKQSQCTWSIVKSDPSEPKLNSTKSKHAWFDKFKSGQNLPGNISSNNQDQHCGPDVFLRLTTSRKL